MCYQNVLLHRTRVIKDAEGTTLYLCSLGFPAPPDDILRTEPTNYDDHSIAM